jgi:hypothetical protein
MGKSFTKVNGRKYQTLTGKNITVFEDTEIIGRIATVDNNIKVSQLKDLPYFKDTSVSGVGYKAK